MIFRVSFLFVLASVIKREGIGLFGFQLNLRDQVTKNTQNIIKLDQAQYKFINQLTKLQDDINDLEEEISKCKTMISRLQSSFEKTSLSNTNKVVFRRFGSLIQNMQSNTEIDDVFYVSPSDGFIWKIDNVSSFLNKTVAELTSNSFYTDGQYGYKIRLKLDNSFGKIRIKLEILKGVFDSLLPWPFNNEIEVSLLSQEYPYNHYTETSLYEPDTCLHRAVKSFKQYSHIYSVQIKKILYQGFKFEREPLVVECFLNGGKDLNNEKVFNRKIKWKIKDFIQKTKLKDSKILEHSFYSGDFGYKLQLVLYPNGVSDSGELDIFLRVLKGDYDDFLWWPFKYNVTIKVLNGNSTKNMCPSEIRNKSSKRSNSELAGFIFFNKSKINNSYPSVIKDNQMFIKFKTKSPLSYIITTQQNRTTVENKEIIWNIKNFNKIKGSPIPIPSEVFQTANFGYDIQMLVYPAGDRSVLGKYASVYIYIVYSSFDHILPWPFQKRLTLSIVDGQNRTVDENIQVFQNKEFVADLKPSFNQGVLIGYSRFMRLIDEWLSKYVTDNCLRIKLKIHN